MSAVVLDTVIVIGILGPNRKIEIRLNCVGVTSLGVHLNDTAIPYYTRMASAEHDTIR